MHTKNDNSNHNYNYKVWKNCPHRSYNDNDRGVLTKTIKKLKIALENKI